MTTARAEVLVAATSGAQQGEVITAWTEWLYENYGGGLTPDQLDKVYGLAWDHGHSSGLAEVGMYFEEFADFARDILNAAKD